MIFRYNDCNYIQFVYFQLDERILEDDEYGYGFDAFSKGFVRSIVMRFWKGETNLKEVWESEYNETLANSTTVNATNLEQVAFFEK